ncbi:MAG: ATP synthase subunit A [Chlamydiae bacterium SM23_39]|nr:MAG: ATP synthase subunit A [Chlamydiae bacterium SM23_39]
MVETKNNNAIGKVVKAFGNLLNVKFEGDIRQGEICFIHLGSLSLSAEVIEINNDEAKVQVFENTMGIKLGEKVSFSSHLLEAELGPGLLTSIYDGLQNPLSSIAEVSGLFLERGVLIPALNREKKWDFNPLAKKNEVLERGDSLGYVVEGRFKHQIMVPFSFFGKYRVEEVVEKGAYYVKDIIAKVKDEEGKIFELPMFQRWPVKMNLLSGERDTPFEIMDTGLRIIDTHFPILKGGSFCSPGPFGAGKTVLQHHLSKYSAVDIVIIAACGERAGEVVEVLKEFPKLINEKTNEPLIDRTVIICNTSSMPVAAREASVYMGVTIGEYYRQMGLNVLLLADSTSRWAQAMREISGRLEEIPGEEAFPAYLSSRIASFYERAGVVNLKNGKKGSLTIGGSVSPAGGNFEEPVTQSTLSVVGAFLGLSRERADARKYPAIDPLISWSKYLVFAGDILKTSLEGWSDKVNIVNFYLKEGSEIGKRMEVIGVEGTVMDDFVIYLKMELYDICYLQQNAFDKEDAYCSMERQIILFKLICEIFEKRFEFETHDEARDYFLSLQNDLKNLNYISFKSEEYYKSLENIRTKMEL